MEPYLSPEILYRRKMDLRCRSRGWSRPASRTAQGNRSRSSPGVDRILSARYLNELVGSHTCRSARLQHGPFVVAAHVRRLPGERDAGAAAAAPGERNRMSLRVLHLLDHSMPLQSGYAFRTRAIIESRGAWVGRHSLTSPRHRAERVGRGGRTGCTSTGQQDMLP